MTKKLSADILRPSQVDAADFMVANPACGIFSDMGFGKTAAVITAVERLFLLKEIKKVLIVSTKNVTQYTWPEELETWEQSSKLKFIRIAGKPQDRIQKATTPAHIYIINQELFVWLTEKAGRKWPFDMVVFDDVSGFSSGQRKSKAARCKHQNFCPLFKPGAPYGCKWAQPRCRYARSCPTSTGCYEAMQCKSYETGPRRFTRFGSVCAIRRQIKRIIHLTGTPTTKDLLDLWPLIYSLDTGRRLERTLSGFKNKYFAKSYNGFTWELRPGAGRAIAQKIKDICVAIPSEAKLPPCYHIEHEVELPPAANKLYKRFAADMIIKIKDGEKIEAANAGVLSGKLLQVCGGAVFKEIPIGQKKAKEWVAVHDEKIKAVKSIIAKHPRTPILIGYNFTHELERLKAAFPVGVDIRKLKNAVNLWNAGKVHILFGHPASMGHGLNLQKGPGNVIIWFGLNWALNLNKQLNKRLWRPGQKQAVYIYYIIVTGLADTNVMKGVARHDYTQNQLLADVRRDTKKLLKKG